MKQQRKKSENFIIACIDSNSTMYIVNGDQLIKAYEAKIDEVEYFDEYHAKSISSAFNGQDKMHHYFYINAKRAD